MILQHVSYRMPADSAEVTGVPNPQRPSRLPAIPRSAQIDAVDIATVCVEPGQTIQMFWLSLTKWFLLLTAKS